MDPIVKFAVYVPFDDIDGVFSAGDGHAQLAFNVEFNIHEYVGKLTFGGTVIGADGQISVIPEHEADIV